MNTLNNSTDNLECLHSYPDAIFLDVNVFAKEGFTSGLLIIIREILYRLRRHGLKIAILSFTDEQSITTSKNFLCLHHFKKNDIDIYEYIFPGNMYSLEISFIEKILMKYLQLFDSKIIIMHTPAVFLHDVDILFQSCANRTSSKVVNVVADELFPTPGNHSKDRVDRLYEELRKAEVITLTKRIQKKFQKISGIKGHPFLNPFTIEDILIDSQKIDYECKYITLINIHPIKGIAIFDKIATMMPDEKFLAVKNWTDVPIYKPSSPNILIKDFFDRPSELYRQTKILLIPSLHNDGPTRVSVEAMLNGIPVIANRIGSIPEMGMENIVFIDPPKIEGFRMQETIMYPIVNNVDIERVATEYCDAIRNILISPKCFFRRQEVARVAAQKYVEKADKIIDNLIRTWL